MSLGELIAVAVTVVLALIAAFWGLLSILFRQSQERIAEKFEALEKSNAERFSVLEKSNQEKFAVLDQSTKELARLEKEFLNFKADLPNQYVRREDYIRNQAVMESKLDAIANLLMTGGNNVKC
jgi:hypothetical protein